eukprot:INCI14749.1.p1 GENE.INCI14749.1~~INCI14749.1.p1  ORF type:complete len:294 (-),score=50.98 INCI14749.1:534-1376(-)
MEDSGPPDDAAVDNEESSGDLSPETLLGRHESPPRPARQRRDLTAPPPSKKTKVAKPKHVRRATGLWLRVAGTSVIDHARIPAPVCKRGTCHDFCCSEGFAAGEIRDFRDQLRKVFLSGGKTAEDSFFKTLMSRVTVRGKSRTIFRSMTPISAGSGFIAGGCQLCNKLSGQHLDRKHNYSRSTCPNWELGQSILKATPVAKHRYFMPPRADGEARRCVSQSFFASVFQTTSTKLERLQQHTTTANVGDLLAHIFQRTNNHSLPEDTRKKGPAKRRTVELR